MEERGGRERSGSGCRRKRIEQGRQGRKVEDSDRLRVGEREAASRWKTKKRERRGAEGAGSGKGRYKAEKHKYSRYAVDCRTRKKKRCRVVKGGRDGGRSEGRDTHVRQLE